MKQIISFVLFFFLLSAGFISCKKDKPVAPDMGYNYFPNQVGRYIIYDVDSMFYDDFNINTTTHIAPIDTFKFQLKEKIQSIYPDNQNRPTIRLERYVRFYDPLIPYSDQPWTLRDVWAENRTATTSEKVEDNVRIVKLIFPVEKDKTWNGNSQNTNAALTYSYLFCDLPRTIGGIKFDSVLQVSQQDESNLIDRKYCIEKYARNVGLIYKQVIDVESQPYSLFTSGELTAFYAIPILQRGTLGFQYTYTVNSFGIE